MFQSVPSSFFSFDIVFSGKVEDFEAGSSSFCGLTLQLSCCFVFMLMYVCDSVKLFLHFTFERGLISIVEGSIIICFLLFSSLRCVCYLRESNEIRSLH